MTSGMYDPDVTKERTMAATKNSVMPRYFVALIVLALAFHHIASAQSVTYDYDARGRLIEADYGGNNAVEYVYDAAGNIVTATDHGPANTLWVIISPTGSGTVTGSGITCPGDCIQSFTGPTQITLTAGSQPGYVFLGWGGDWTSLSNPTVVNMNTDRRIGAHFGDSSGSTDGDGISDSIESGPSGNDPGFDGDGNGVPDYQEARAASLPTFSGDGYATLAVPDPLVLTEVAAVDNPSPGYGLYHHSYQFGFFDFTIQGLDPGDCTTLSLILTHDADTLSLDSYDKYGPYPGHPSPEWYVFDHDGQTGARITNGETETVMELDLCDAERGDDVLVEDAQIIDVGGPAHWQCLTPPNFNAWADVENVSGDSCGLLVTWPDGGYHYCGTGFVYNLYRSTTSDFTPGPENLLSACIEDTFYLDEDVEYAVEYFYTVEAEDNSGEADGPCFSGNVREGVNEASGIPAGPTTVPFEEDFTTIDGFTLEPGPNDAGSATWIHPWEPWAPSPPSSVVVFCGSVVTDQLLIQSADEQIPAGGQSMLEFFQNLNTETGFDGGVFEYSTDDGATWHDILAGDGGAIPDNPDRFLVDGYNSVLSADHDNPLPGRNAWSDRLYGPVQIDVSDFAGRSVRFRWRFGCDSSYDGSGYWGIDDFLIRNIAECGYPLFADGFESGDTSAW